MTLGFSQQIKGVNNFFVPKIWTGLMPPSMRNSDLFNVIEHYHNFSKYHLIKFGRNFEILDVKPKIHTIRAGERWRAGMDIHMVINNRTSNRFQFAPTIKCKSVQKIKFKWYESNELQDPALVGCVYNPRKNIFCYVAIDGVQLSHYHFNILAINDGFDSVDAFFEYFNKDFTGQLIHWTDLLYARTKQFEVIGTAEIIKI